MNTCIIPSAMPADGMMHVNSDDDGMSQPSSMLLLGWLIPASDRYSTIDGVPLGPAIYSYTNSVSRSRGSQCPVDGSAVCHSLVGVILRLLVLSLLSARYDASSHLILPA